MTQSLSAQIKSGKFVTAPGVFDGLSARIAEAQGADALYLTGYGVSASLLGQPDAGFLERDHMVDRIRAIKAVTDTPIIADADTGFDDIGATVKAYADAGASAIQIEDQVFPKRCGHTSGRKTVPLEEAVDRVKAALDARDNSDLLLIARTDALTQHGVDAAIERARAFHEAGADILFVESPETLEDLERIAKGVPGAVQLANMVEGGRSPFLSPDQLAAMGFGIAIYPLIGLASAAAGLEASNSALRQNDLSNGQPNNLARMSFDQLNRAVGFEEIWQADRDREERS